MQSDPVVSICIPTYNQPALTRRLLESIHVQTYTNYEVVITDDTPDSTVQDVVEQYREVLPIKFFKNEHSLGSPENWNEAIRKAQGKYIKIMHHDDWFASVDSLRIMTDHLQARPEVDFVFCASGVWMDGVFTSVHYPSWVQRLCVRYDPRYLFGRNCIGAPSATMYKRHAEPIFDARLMWVVDIDFYMSYMQRYRNFLYIDQPLVNTAGGGAHQVTAQCANNPDVDVRECAVLFDKIYSEGDFFFSQYARVFFMRLFRKYKIRSITEIPVKDLNDATVRFFQTTLKISNILL